MKASFVYVPPKGGKSRTFQASPWMLKLVAAGAVALVIFVIGAFFLTMHLASEMAEYQTLRNRTVSQDLLLRENTKQFQQLQENIESLLDAELEIRNMLNKPDNRQTEEELVEAKKKRVSEFRKTLNKSSKNPKVFTNFLVNNVGTLKSEISQHYTQIQHYRKRFAATPSIWPVHGNIQSGFGSRLHPVLGRHVFHKGIDIPSWSGAPVQATADGIVEYSGWSGSYGNVMIIDHSYGYRTIYAHMSKLLARTSQKVKKGQTIGQIGSTGLSTGPHLHYEVLKWEQSVPPASYLNLDMFTAADRMW